MILSTTYMDHSWLNRILDRRKAEGRLSTRPWAVILVEGEQNTGISSKLLENDLLLEVPKYILPTENHPLSKIHDDLSDSVVGFIKNAYTSPTPYWVVASCATGKGLSGAFSKWTSDMCLVPISAMYPGHNIDTSCINKKIYNALNPELLVAQSFEFTF